MNSDRIFKRWVMPSDIVWLLSAALLIGALVQLRPVDDRDIYTQVRLGQLHRANLELIDREPFSYLNENNPIEHPGWLAQLTYSWTYDQGGWPLSRLLHSLLFAGAFMAIGLWTRKLLGGHCNGFSLFFALMCGALVGMSNAALRPQGVALFGFALTALLAESRQSFLTKVVLVAIIGTCWQNSHPSIGLAVLVWGSYGVAALWRWRYDQGAFKNCFQFFGLMLLSFCLQWLTPVGSAIFEISQKNLLISREVLGVSEWLPPYSPVVQSAMLGFWALALFCIVVGCFCKPRQFRLESAFLFCFFLIVSLWACRFALFWGAIGVPVVYVLFERMRPKSVFNCTAENIFSNGKAVVRCCLVFVCLISLWVLGWQRNPVDPNLPLACVKELSKYPEVSRVYNYREWGGLLALEGLPQWRIGLDGRLYLYTEENFKNYQDEARGVVPLAKIERRYSADAMFLRADYHAALIDLLNEDPKWVHSCRVGRAILFVEHSKVPDALKSEISGNSRS